MKKVISLILVFVVCLSLCACGKKVDPQIFSNTFQTEEELISTFNTFFSNENWEGLKKEKKDKIINEFVEILRNNTAIHHYFQKGDEAVALAHKLSENPILEAHDREYIWLIFEACNDTNWYAGMVSINKLGQHEPFFCQAWEEDAPTYSSVTNAIKNEFSDPLSVSILKGKWAFMPPVDGYYELPFEFVGIVDVRFANGFGGYMTKEYLITGTLGGQMHLDSSFSELNSMLYESFTENGCDQYMRKY